MAVYVTLKRSILVKKGACRDGLALFDTIACGKDKIRTKWTPLAYVWACASYPEFARWLINNRLVPEFSLFGANLSGANLSGANLSGAYRLQSDGAIDGWVAEDCRLKRT